MKKILFSTLLFFNVCRASESETSDLWRVKMVFANNPDMAQTFAFDRKGARLSISEAPTDEQRISKIVQIFDTNTGALLYDFKQEGVFAVAFNPHDDNKIALTLRDTVLIWDINQGSSVLEMCVDDSYDEVALGSLAFNGCGNQIAAGCCNLNNNLFLFDLNVGNLVKTKPHYKPVHAVTFTRDQKIQAIGSDFNDEVFFTIWDPGTTMATYRDIEDEFCNVTFAQGSPTTMVLMDDFDGGELRVIDNFKTPEQVTRKVELNDDTISSTCEEIALSTDGNMIMCVAKNTTTNQEDLYLLERISK